MNKRSTASHRRHQSPSRTKLSYIANRAHVTRWGVPKRRYTPTEAEEALAQANGRLWGAPLQAYACPDDSCGWIHLGHAPKPHVRFDPIVDLESGMRVEACIRAENSGSDASRMTAIADRCRSAEMRRRLSLPSSKRRGPLP